MSEGAKKLDAGKLPVMRGVFLRFPRAMYELAKVSQAGTTKYAVPIDDMNYKNVPDGEGRYTDALGRHLLDEAIGGQMNVEKGGALPEQGVELLHKAQAAWDALARLEIYLEQQHLRVDNFRMVSRDTFKEILFAPTEATKAATKPFPSDPGQQAYLDRPAGQSRD